MSSRIFSQSFRALSHSLFLVRWRHPCLKLAHAHKLYTGCGCMGYILIRIRLVLATKHFTTPWILSIWEVLGLKELERKKIQQSLSQRKKRTCNGLVVFFERMILWHCNVQCSLLLQSMMDMSLCKICRKIELVEFHWKIKLWRLWRIPMRKRDVMCTFWIRTSFTYPTKLSNKICSTYAPSTSLYGIPVLQSEGIYYRIWYKKFTKTLASKVTRPTTGTTQLYNAQGRIQDLRKGGSYSTF